MQRFDPKNLVVYNRYSDRRLSYNNELPIEIYRFSSISSMDPIDRQGVPTMPLVPGPEEGFGCAIRGAPGQSLAASCESTGYGGHTLALMRFRMTVTTSHLTEAILGLILVVWNVVEILS